MLTQEDDVEAYALKRRGWSKRWEIRQNFSLARTPANASRRPPTPAVSGPSSGEERATAAPTLLRVPLHFRRREQRSDAIDARALRRGDSNGGRGTRTRDFLLAKQATLRAEYAE